MDLCFFGDEPWVPNIRFAPPAVTQFGCGENYRDPGNRFSRENRPAKPNERNVPSTCPFDDTALLNRNLDGSGVSLHKPTLSR
jgi:hypothetical protein